MNLCRRCSECTGHDHHWMHGEAPFAKDGTLIAEFACKHCDVLGDMANGQIVVKRGLHVFCMGDTDYVIAHNVDDAWALLSEQGYERDEYHEDDLEELPDGGSLAIRVDADGDITDDSGEPLKRTHAEWAEREGRGFLCSTEF